VRTHSDPEQKGTSEVKHTEPRPRFAVTADGKAVVSHVGARLLCDLAAALGLNTGLSSAMAPTRERRGGYDRGRLLVDLAVMLADGGQAISDLCTLRDQPSLFGEVASVPTAWRTLEAIGPDQLAAIAHARAAARARAWAAGADPGWYVLDFDATLVHSHSEKEGAAPTYKKGFGFHPLLVYLDATGEALAGKLRSGNAGSNTVADHIEVLDAALAQLPVDPHGHELVARADSAGLTHGFLEACRERHVRFVVGHDLTATVRTALAAVPERRWQPATTADGMDEREGAEVAEITDLVDLDAWPAGSRLIARREYPHPGAQLTFTDLEGRRFQTLLTDLPDRDIAFLEALYRGRGRAECRIRDAKDGGLANLPSTKFAINTAWLQLVMLAQDLLAWTARLCLAAPLARAEPRRLRYCLLHTAGIIVRGGRRLRLRLPADWRWSAALVIAFARVRALSTA
jgi:hypothetical protein